MKHTLVILVNTLLVFVIVFLIIATWMPAIYNSEWFQTNNWVRNHMLKDDPKPAAHAAR